MDRILRRKKLFSLFVKFSCLAAGSLIVYPVEYNDLFALGNKIWFLSE